MNAGNLVGGTVRERIGAALLRAYQAAAFYCVLAAFGVVFLGWNAAAAVLRWVLPHRVAICFGQAGISWGFRNLLRLIRLSGLAEFDLTALDALRGEPGLVIAPNHPALIDVVLVISRLPRVVCIAKASLWDNPALGAGARLAGYIRNDASQHRLVRQAGQALRQGQQLLIFPEGTRTASGRVGPMKGGFALMARQAGASVQTVLLESNTAYLSKDWPLLKQPMFPLFFRARLGRRFQVEGDAAGFAAQLEAYFRSELTHS